MGRSFITKRQSGGPAARSGGEESRQQGESLCRVMLPLCSQKKEGKNRFMSSQLPGAVNTSRAAASLLRSGSGTKFNHTIKKVEDADGVGGYTCEAVTRILWLDMTVDWKLIPRCLSPPHLNSPLTRAELTGSRVGSYFEFKNKQKMETKGPELSYLHKSGLLITVSGEELKAQTSGCWPDGGPYLPTLLTLRPLNRQGVGSRDPVGDKTLSVRFFHRPISRLETQSFSLHGDVSK